MNSEKQDIPFDPPSPWFRMSRHSLYLRILICVLAGVSLIACGSGPVDRPNVVLVITDDQGYGDLSCHGNPVLKTPSLDRLTRESVRLTDYHVAPTCSPTRSALQTGRWTNRTGVWHTIMGRSLLPENEVTLGQVFKEAGYAAGMFGKRHLGDNYPFRPEDRGYTEVMRHGTGRAGLPDDAGEGYGHREGDLGDRRPGNGETRCSRSQRRGLQPDAEPRPGDADGPLDRRERPSLRGVLRVSEKTVNPIPPRSAQ